MTDTTIRALRTPQQGILLINSPITDAVALNFCEELDSLFGYYQYDTVMVRIHSPGGQILALDYMMECIDEWRNRGRKLHTHATMQAISAAALLLSLGEVGNRSASLCSGLLYHQTRFVTPSSHTLTAAAAMFAAKQLIESDRRLMERLCTHLLDGYGGELAFAQTALMRIEKISRVRISNPEAVTPSWERITKNAFEEVASKGNIQAYQSLLMRRFDEDSLMSLDEALALMLIDDVQPTGIPLNL